MSCVPDFNPNIYVKELRNRDRYVPPSPPQIVKHGSYEIKDSKNIDDLDIRNYSFNDILALFELQNYNVSYTEIKRAKNITLMKHPDKSRLPPEYFLFYKKALDILVKYYQEATRQEQIVENRDYTTDDIAIADLDNSNDMVIRKTISSIGNAKAFNKQFNNIFEQNIGVANTTNDKNKWFNNVEPLFVGEIGVSSATGINAGIERIKQQQQIIKYGGEFRELTTTANLYGDDDSEPYIVCDPFQKLKYDDIARVHKDQTVFPVSEADYANIPQYNDDKEYIAKTRSADIAPLDKAESERILREKNEIYVQSIAHKQYATELQIRENIEKNKKILGQFVLLQ